MSTKRVLAFDFGASSGRAILGTFDGEKITLNEIHRFSNDPVKVGDTLYWDILRLFHEIKQGILKAKHLGGFDSIGIDTWGVDFGLIGCDGALLENPVHYRDERNNGMIEDADKIISKEELYSLTGIQFMQFNTLYQLLSLKLKRPHILERTKRLLFMPDLMSYMLTGEIFSEYSIATTSQLVDLKTGEWSYSLMDRFGFPKDIFAPIVKTGTEIGRLRADIAEELGVDRVKVIAVAGHDTQSAVTAVPSLQKDFAFISSGTWSLLGTESDKPFLTKEAMDFNITNEGGFEGSIAFLKNICGLWLIQESRRQWIREGEEHSYAELERFALDAEPFKCFIDPDAPDFLTMGDLPNRIREFCRRTNQYVPRTKGEIVRCIYESLSMKYKYTLSGIEKCTKKVYDKIHVVGGGVKDTFLCALTADSCNRTVCAGPIEATVLGNISVQLLADGSIESIEKAREIISRCEDIRVYEPKNPEAYDAAYDRFLSILNG